MDAEEDMSSRVQSELWSEKYQKLSEQSEKILLFMENSYAYIQDCYLI